MMKKTFFLFFFLVIVISFCQSTESWSEPLAVSNTPLVPSETVDTETESLGIPNRLAMNDFNIFINPAQIMEWGTAYGEVWNETGIEWGGGTVAVGNGKLGVFLGRPYLGKVAQTGALPSGAMVTGIPSNTVGYPLVVDPIGAPTFFGAPTMYTLNPLGIGGNQLDLLYGKRLSDKLIFGFALSMANNVDEETYTYEESPAGVNSAGEGNISNKLSSSDMGISLGVLLKEWKSVDKLDLALTLSNPKVNNEFTEKAYTAANAYGEASDKLVSNNGINISLLGRAILLDEKQKLVTALKIETSDITSKRTIQVDNDATTPDIDTRNRETEFKDTGLSMNMDVALHTMPNDKLKLIYSAGIATFSRNIDVLEKGLSVAGVVAPGNLNEEKGTYAGSGIPVAFSLEHQTWKKVATRFSASTILFSNATNEVINMDWIDTNADGVTDIVDENSVTETKISPRMQVATVGLGLGIKPAEKVTVDIALKANIFDLDTGAGVADFISRASLKYSF